MTEPTTAQPEPTPAEASKLPESKQTLEELYTEYNVGREVQGDTNAAPTPPEPAPGANEESAIRAKLANLESTIQADRQERARAQEEADLNNAITRLGKEAGMTGKDSLLKGYLIAQANDDARLRTLWERRHINPKAWDSALKILADDVREQFSVPNPQLEENQRAMDESQRAQTTTAPAQPKPEDKVMSMKDSEFDHFWAKLTGRGF